MRFWRTKRAFHPQARAESRWPELLDFLRCTPSDLMVITGPEDGGSVCSDWIGAVVSVGGRSTYFPALVDAIEDGVFHSDCRHKMIPFRREEGEAEALFCTKFALTAMVRRRRNGRAKHDGTANGADTSEPPAARETFTRLYDEARAAEQDGRLADALERCQTALRLLGAHDMFGSNQAEVTRVLKGRMQTILRSQADCAKPRPGTG
jgi:hypothetical protein